MWKRDEEIDDVGRTINVKMGKHLCQRKALRFTEQGTNAFTSMCSYATSDVTVLSDMVPSTFRLCRLRKRENPPKNEQN